MNCDQFQRRLDLVLDQRRDVSADESLSAHAAECDLCRDRIHTWSTIDVLVGRDDESPNAAAGPVVEPALGGQRASHLRRRGLAAFGLATAIALCVTPLFRPQPKSISDATIAVRHAAGTEPTAAIDSVVESISPPREAAPDASEMALEFPADRWWSVMTEEHWVDHTIPAVDSVRQGVAPIGRSMRRALAILMIQTGRPSIDRTDLDAEPAAGAPQEQTSSRGSTTFENRIA